VLGVRQVNNQVRVIRKSVCVKRLVSPGREVWRAFSNARAASRCLRVAVGACGTVSTLDVPAARTPNRTQARRRAPKPRPVEDATLTQALPPSSGRVATTTGVRFRSAICLS
jgi:hypothetical protein